jgi:hypothetical protein
MIGDFENIDVQTYYPVKNEVDGSAINCMFIVGQSFTFANAYTLETKANWLAYIKAQTLTPITNLEEVDDESERPTYLKSDLGYEYKASKGKYKYTFKTTYNKQYHDNLKLWSGRDFRVLLGDVNKNIHGYLVGSTIKGFNVELFSVEEKQFGGNDPGWTIIKLVLKDSSEYNFYDKLTWNPNQLNVNFVTLSSITGGGAILEFTIKDSLYDIYITNLYIGDLTITDSQGGRHIDSLTEIGIGEYRITANGSLKDGVITINSNRFYGSGTYVVDA